MTAAFIKNKYYSDSGIDYIFLRLKDEFAKLGVTLTEQRLFVSYPQTEKPNFSCAIFWDKDICLAKQLEREGVKVFNSAKAIETCDDKEKTFAALTGYGITLPRTIVAPLVYDVNNSFDEAFLKQTAKELKFPLIVKENVGSQGRQVWLIKNFDELITAEQRELHVSHLYQEFVQGKYGSDLRVYLVGGIAIAAAERSNTTDFHSNVCRGGKMTLAPLTAELTESAEKIAAALGLDFGSADFILSPNGPVFIEANSNAYFKTVESLGVNVAEKIARHVCEGVSSVKE